MPLVPVAVSVARGMDGRFGSESPLALLDSHLVKCILSIALLGFQRETE